MTGSHNVDRRLDKNSLFSAERWGGVKKRLFSCMSRVIFSETTPNKKDTIYHSSFDISFMRA
jgi:hypothetical protein